MSIEDFLNESDDEAKTRGSLRAVGRALDSRWMMGVAVLSVIAAIAWSVQTKKLRTASEASAPARRAMPSVSLLGVPVGSVVELDGRPVQSHRFAINPEVRHAIEVRATDGRSWRQVVRTDGALVLVVDFGQVVTLGPLDEPSDTQDVEVTDGGAIEADGLDPDPTPKTNTTTATAKPKTPARTRRVRRAKPAVPPSSAKEQTPSPVEDEPEKDSSLVQDPGF